MNLEFRKMTREDTYGFMQWGKHDDPRYYQYNFPYKRKAEFDAWYFSKQKLISRKVFGLFLDGKPIGFITLKNIKWFRRRAELGIAIDPNHLNEGYGTELIKRFSEHVFAKYPIDTLQLKVSHFNTRAQKSYQKIGFKIIKEVEEPFEEQGYKDIIIRKYPDLFSMDGDTLYTTFYVMQYEKNQMQ